MGKRLNTTVHLVDDESGERTVLGPSSKLSRAQEKQLRDLWGKRADDFFESDGDDDVLSAEEQLEAGHPPASGTPAADKGPVAEGMQLNEDARTEANPEGKADSESSGRKSSR